MSETIYDLIADCIGEDDDSLILELLSEIDLDNMLLEDKCALYYFSLAICHQLDKKLKIPVISNFFGKEIESKIESYVLSYRPHNINVFNFYIKHNDRDLGFYAQSLFSFDNEAVIHEIWNTFTSLPIVRKRFNYELCMLLIDSLNLLSEDETPYGGVIEDLLKNFAGEYASDITKPNHVLDPLEFGFSEIPSQSALEEYQPNRTFRGYKSDNRFGRIRQIAEEMAQESFEAGQIKRDAIPSTVTQIVAQTETYDWDEFMKFFSDYERKKIEKEYQQDTGLARIFGPCHPKMGSYKLGTEGETDVCRRYGGCRMMTCVEFEYDEEDPDGELFWYTGNCDVCCKKIPFKHWAFRVALETGGYKGCYCSKEHAVEACVDSGYGLAMQTTERICQSLLETGIYDRYIPKFDRRAYNKIVKKLGREMAEFLDETKEAIVLTPLLPPDLTDDIIEIN
jgi:hypothetical protein